MVWTLAGGREIWRVPEPARMSGCVGLKRSTKYEKTRILAVILDMENTMNTVVQSLTERAISPYKRKTLYSQMRGFNM